MSAKLYVLGDADRVREQIEGQLLEGNLANVAKFSANLSSGLIRLVRAAERSLQAETIMAGGDDVLLRIPAEVFSLEALRDISGGFYAETGCTISFGVGSEVQIAYLNLRRAKAAGGGRVVAFDGVGP